MRTPVESTRKSELLRTTKIIYNCRVLWYMISNEVSVCETLAAGRAFQAGTFTLASPPSPGTAHTQLLAIYCA